MSEFRPIVPRTEFVIRDRLNLDRLANLVDKANRRLDRLDDARRFEVEVTERVVLDRTEFENADSDNLIEVFVPVWDVVLNRPKVVRDGWEFVGVVAAEGNGVLISAVPDADISDFGRRPEMAECDHCGHNRARNKSFIIRHADGTYKVVGSTCITDFFDAGVHGLWMLEAFDDAELRKLAERDDSGIRRDWIISLDSLIRIALAVSREGKGYVSVAKADLPSESTKGHVLDAIFPSNFPDARAWARDVADKAASYSDDIVADVKAAVADMRPGDYADNLRVILDNGTVSLRSIGLAASMVTVYARAQAAQDEKVAEAPINQTPLAEVKTRVRNVPITVRRVNYTEGMYGTTTILNMRDADNRIIVWFASGERNYEPGDKLLMTATVKAEETYKGDNQTIVTRAVLTPAE